MSVTIAAGLASLAETLCSDNWSSYPGSTGNNRDAIDYVSMKMQSAIGTGPRVFGELSNGLSAYTPYAGAGIIGSSAASNKPIPKTPSRYSGGPLYKYPIPIII